MLKYFEYLIFIKNCIIIILESGYIMICSNKFCIYWNENKCILESVSLDVLGCCESCIYIDIEESELKKYRNRLLERYG